MYVWRVIAILVEDLLECRIERDQPIFRVGRHAIAMGGVRADCLHAVRSWVDSRQTLSAEEFPDFQAGHHEAALVRAGNRVAVPSTL